MRATELCPTRLHRPEERDLFTTANFVLPIRGTGDIWDAASSFRTLRHVLYPLSYSCFQLAGFEPASSSLTAKYQISSPPLGKAACRGTVETETTPGAQGDLLSEEGPQPASRRPSPGRLHGTHSDAGVAAIVERLGAKYPISSPPTLVSRGTDDAALFLPKESASSPPGIQKKISSVSRHCFLFGGSRGAGNRNPSGAWAREGFDQIELWKSVSSSGPREKARASHRTDQTIRRCSTSR